MKMGYSLVDTANAYVNERACGRGIKDSGAAREDVFLSTKLWPSEYENPNAVDETLERLGVDYVDLLYIHQPAGNWLAGYRQLEKAYREGKDSLRDLQPGDRILRSEAMNKYDFSAFDKVNIRGINLSGLSDGEL